MEADKRAGVLKGVLPGTVPTAVKDTIAKETAKKVTETIPDASGMYTPPPTKAEKDATNAAILAKNLKTLEGVGQDPIDASGMYTTIPTKESERMEKVKAAAAAVPESIDRYQADIEVPRVSTDMKKVAQSMGKGFSNVGDLNAVDEEKIPDSQAAIDVKTPTSSATEIANADPSRVGAVLEKLKEEEKRGGPNFFDILEAAAAGWNGKIPMYVQKEIAAKEQEEQLDKMNKAAALDEAAQEKQRGFQKALQLEGFAHDEKLAREAAANRLALAGMGGTTGGISLNPLDIIGGK